MPTQAQITDHVIYDVLLLSDIPPTASFGINLALIDEDSIPVDKRVVIVSPTSYSEDLPAGSNALAYATTYFSQDLKADSLFFGRLVETATAPYWLWGPESETDFEVWKLITDGEFTVRASDLDEDNVTAIDFSGVTSISQVYALIEDELQALVAPNITGLDSATVTVDASGRISINLPASESGSTTPTIEVIPVSGGTGTDVSSLMDDDNGTSIAGYDVETATESFSACRTVDDSFYNVEAVRNTDAVNLELAAVIQGLKKQLTVVTKTAACLNPALDTDIMSVLQANGYDRTLCIYDADLDTQFVAAAVEGRLLPTEEGTTNWAFTTLTGVTSNGLSVSERKAIKDKNGNYLETVGTSTYLYQGITSGNVEKRLILGIDWFEDRCQVDNFAALLNLPLLGFDDDTITLIYGILDRWSTEAISRKIFVNTKERPFSITLPAADDFTQLDRASHKMTINNAFEGYANSAVNDILVRGSISI